MHGTSKQIVRTNILSLITAVMLPFSSVSRGLTKGKCVAYWNRFIQTDSISSYQLHTKWAKQSSKPLRVYWTKEGGKVSKWVLDHSRSKGIDNHQAKLLSLIHLIHILPSFCFFFFFFCADMRGITRLKASGLWQYVPASGCFLKYIKLYVVINVRTEPVSGWTR